MTTLKLGYLTPFNELRHSIVSSLLFQLTKTIETRGFTFNSIPRSRNATYFATFCS